MPSNAHLERLALDGWRVEYDPQSTRRAYDSAREARDLCECTYCRNYRSCRDTAQPIRLKAMLIQLGIDPAMEAEVSELGPAESGRRLYAGWYTFVGALRQDPGDRMLVIGPDEAGTAEWLVFFTDGGSLAFETFGDARLGQLQFQVELPWVLDEPPPPHERQ